MSSYAPWDDARARLEGAGLGVPIAWPNEPFGLPNPPSIFISVDMTGNVLAPIEMGPNGGWQEDGELLVEIYTPVGGGSADARTLAKRIVNIFRALPPAPTTYHGASLGSGRSEDIDGNWWRFSIRVDYRYQDVTV